ncbi:MAG: rhodanese-like domain-containing protein [Pseudomonadota bacterium]
MIHFTRFGRNLFAMAAIAVLTALLTLPSLAAEPLVDADWLAENLDRDDLKVIDLRGPMIGADFEEQVAEGHIPGAVHAPYPSGWRAEVEGVAGQLPPVAEIEAFIRALGINTNDTVVLVPGATTASEFGTATRVYWTFKVLGHDAVAILNGGWPAWAANPERPVASGPMADPEITSDFVAVLQSDLIVSTEEVEARIAENTGVLIDGRPEAQFLGTEKHGLSALFGRLSGATHLDQSVFYDPETGGIRDDVPLASLVPAALTDRSVEVVSYCNTGHWASMNWFVLSELLEYEDVRLYDASMVGWTQGGVRETVTGSVDG